MFYGAFYDEGSVYLALEYMDCGSLDTIMKILREVNQNKYQNQFIPEIIISKIVLQVLLALLDIQNNKAIHRDIKPDNILISTNQYYNLKSEITQNYIILAKLGDFGISKKLDVTMCNSVVGTYSHMSPERQVDNPIYNQSCDIWSLGLVSYEMGTGQFPYSTNPFIIRQQIRENDAPSLQGVQGFSQEFTDFISKCLQKDPTQRSSAQELLNHIFIQKHNCGQEDLNFVHEWISNFIQAKQAILNKNRITKVNKELFGNIIKLNQQF